MFTLKEKEKNKSEEQIAKYLPDDAIWETNLDTKRKNIKEKQNNLYLITQPRRQTLAEKYKKIRSSFETSL